MTSPLVPPDLQALFDGLIEEHGCIGLFSQVQLEIATVVVRVMRDLRCAAAGDVVRLSDVLAKLLGRLSPTLPRSRAHRPLPANMPLTEMVTAYQLMLRDEAKYEDYIDGW